MDSDAAARLHQAAEIIKARAAVLSAWSSRIPQSLEISEEDYAVVITANPEIAPDARAYELGIRHRLNYPNQERGGHFGKTPRRPFLEPAVDQTADQAAEKCALVVSDWCQKLGYK